MSTCVPTPVSTVFSTVTENIIATTYSLSTSTTPPVVTARVDPYCQDEAVLLDSAVCLRTATRTTTETLQRTFQSSWFAPLFSRIPCLVLFCLSSSLDSEKLTMSSFYRDLIHSPATIAAVPGLIPIQRPISFRPYTRL